MTERFLLPSHVVPSHYTLEITPDFKKLNFDVNEVIEVTVKEEINEISLHCKEISIESVNFTNGTQSLDAIAINFNLKYDIVTFVFDEPLKVGNGQIKIKFTGILNGDMAGFYKCK